MGIVLPAPPETALGVLTEAVADLQVTDPSRTLGAAETRVAPHPFPLYVVGLASIRRGSNSIRAARPAGWRYLLERGGAPAIADLHATATGESVYFGRLVAGDTAERLLERAREAEALASGQDFEARILDVPALHVAALWLHGSTSLFLPIGPDVDPAPLDLAAFQQFLLDGAIRLRAASRQRSG